MFLHQINSFYEIDAKREADREWESGWGACETQKEVTVGRPCKRLVWTMALGTLAVWAARWPQICVLESSSRLWAWLTPLMKHKEQMCLTLSYFVMTWTHVNIKIQILNCGRDIWCSCKVWKISIFREKLRNQEINFSQDSEIPSQKYICSFHLLSP